jgi:hypothetical protein
MTGGSLTFRAGVDEAAKIARELREVSSKTAQHCGIVIVQKR